MLVGTVLQCLDANGAQLQAGTACAGKAFCFQLLLFTVPVGSARLVPGMSSLQQGCFNEKRLPAGLPGSPLPSHSPLAFTEASLLQPCFQPSLNLQSGEHA